MGSRWIEVGRVEDWNTTDRRVVSAGDRPVLLLRHAGGFWALDNRCPHMGFPLDRGSVRDCILTCHWHDARFDVRSGGTFDQFADDVRAYPVELRGDRIWIDIAPRENERAHQIKRLHDGLERSIRLVIAKAAIALLDGGGDAREPFRAGIEFGTRYRGAGWGQGLTMLACFGNMLPRLDPADRPRAMFHGLDAVAVDGRGMAPRFVIDPLPGAPADLATLARWFGQFMEVRDEEGAERCIVSAVHSGAGSAEMAELLFGAITDHRYIDIGHPADFANKALEALDLAGWDLAAPTLAALARPIARAARMEESNAWRHPIDLVALLERCFEALPAALADGETRRAAGNIWSDRTALARRLLGDDPQANFEALVQALRDGAWPEDLAGAVAYAAALRIAQFHTANEFGDWDTVLHTWTFANAMQQAIRRIVAAPESRVSPAAAPEQRALPALRGVFDAAASVYLDRFLNMPPARLPRVAAAETLPNGPRGELFELLDRQQQVAAAAELAAHYLNGQSSDRLLAALGAGLLREDRDFHTIQAIEAAFRQHELLHGTPEAEHVVIAAARYLAAHAPTSRSQGQTFGIAERLHRGEKLYEE